MEKNQIKQNDYFNKAFAEICEKENLVGANIVVTNENEILERTAYGLQDIEENIPSSTDTVYRIASISKTVGSIGLMQLVEKGLIDLDEDISKYLGFLVRNPKYPNDIITVKMITMQTSSIQDGYDDENPEYDDIHKGYNGINGTYIDVTLKELLTDTNSKYYTPLTYGNYKPGTRFCYSNFGCGIMACIIEKISGELYVDYMENHVFKPLNLNASFKAKRIKDHSYIASMYYLSSKGLHKCSKEGFINSGLPVYELGNNFRGPAGGLFITMTDLSKIMRMFLNYGTYNNVQILKRETVERMYQEEWCGLPGDEYRAKGIQMRIIEPVPSMVLRGHTGGAYGVKSYMFFNLKHKLGACFITNGINNRDGSSCQRVFDETQKLWIKMYSTSLPSKVEIHENMVKLEEREIHQKNLLINQSNPYILGKTLADLLSTLAIFNENELSYTFNYHDKHLVINNIIMYKDELYVNLLETLKALDVKYVYKDNVYYLEY